MSLESSIQVDIRRAMRDKDVATLAVLRFLWAAVKQKHIDERVEFSDEMIVSVLLKEKKKRMDSIDCYQAAARIDLVNKEKFELEIISRYLPAHFSEEELSEKLDEVFSAVNPSKMADLSSLMLALRPVLSGRADFGKVSLLVKEKLAKYLDDGNNKGIS
ncbi:MULTISPECIES: GatB/YqeY domain-containing protein [Candidatus Ichthyocystis]|uniref:Putative glutamyl-tRNA amidotransferase n=1 Tax=Candidatus Ichthyocystis hellenicum TaxID=1561003 RepID=A0A0S4M156_9BURK|nr:MULTISPECIES: GatB/YqeY domain-containing protein [Ichthyocystis]CUT17019.1 putative glutamyl-tRNA amidotransferase [Candidatus Ichthyocystis hellenicum]